MNYQLISPILGLLRLVLVAVLLCSLGLWLELLWFTATHNSDAFWRFSAARIAFAVAGTAFACGLCWWFQTRQQPPAHCKRARRGALVFSLATLTGAVSGLGLWELVRMLVAHSEAADLLRVWQNLSILSSNQ